MGRLPVVERGESGLMGMALDPDYSDNSYGYLCYTRSGSGDLENVVQRFMLTDTGLDNGKVILDDMRGSSIHDGCRLVLTLMENYL